MKKVLQATRFSLLLAISASLMGMALACTSPKNQQQDKEREPVQILNSEDFPHLQEQLFALSIAQRPEDFAQTNQLDYKDGKVWVKIELKNAQEPLPPGYNIVTDTRVGNLVQAWIDLKELRKLSQEPQVEYVSPLQKPQP
jgi:hypothetical protein